MCRCHSHSCWTPRSLLIVQCLLENPRITSTSIFSFFLIIALRLSLEGEHSRLFCLAFKRSVLFPDYVFVWGRGMDVHVSAGTRCECWKLNSSPLNSKHPNLGVIPPAASMFTFEILTTQIKTLKRMLTFNRLNYEGSVDLICIILM